MSNRTILVCSTGSVATIKLPEILKLLNDNINNVKLNVVLTEKAKHFCTIDSIDMLIEKVYTDSDWNTEKEESNFLHEELAKQADLLLIAPLDANSLAKIANGLCDNLLTSIVRVWDFNNKMSICCPAMNTQMWIHPITEIQIQQLQSFGFKVILPITKKLACGDFGVGAMEEPKNIVSTIKQCIEMNAKKIDFHETEEELKLK